MKATRNFLVWFSVLLVLGFSNLVLAGDQKYLPSGWVNDPFCKNVNYGVAAAFSSSPCFTNNGVQRGTLYANSAIGKTLPMVKAGDSIRFEGQVEIAGDINTNGNLQFRFGLYLQGTNKTDINWLGYTVGNVTGDESGASGGLYVRNNPSQGVYSSGSPGNAMRPQCDEHTYVPGWVAGDYNFYLQVKQLSAHEQKVSWELAGIAPAGYKFGGAYTNTFPLTTPPSFDQVGILAGAALFQSASVSNSLSFKNMVVTYESGGGSQVSP